MRAKIRVTTSLQRCNWLSTKSEFFITSHRAATETSNDMGNLISFDVSPTKNNAVSDLVLGKKVLLAQNTRLFCRKSLQRWELICRSDAMYNVCHAVRWVFLQTRSQALSLMPSLSPQRHGRKGEREPQSEINCAQLLSSSPNCRHRCCHEMEQVYRDYLV